MREGTKHALRPWVRWKGLEAPREGYSIVLGVPWALRHLLAVNLRFVAAQEREGLDRVFVVFDRPAQEAGDAFIAATVEAFPELPLDLRFQPRPAADLVHRVGRSKFYASLNWVTGLAHCETRHAVLHDFDLFPVQPDFFRRIHRSLRERGLRFSGAEHTRFDGLTERDALIGTWELGIDVAWLRANHRAIDCFHKWAHVGGRLVDLDAFSWIQSRTAERALADGVSEDSFVHVKNLCSTYLRVSQGQPAQVAWRLHSLWYLESLVGETGGLDALSARMDAAAGPALTVRAMTHDFSDVHVTCANVLEHEVERMEAALHGATRPEAARFVASTRRFLERHGRRED